MNPPENLFFSELLRQFRTRKRLSQKELAKLIGMSREIVGLWERGYYKPETDTTLYELVRVLGLTGQEQQQLFEAYTVTALTTSFHNPPRERNSYFTGRGPQLAQLHKLLTAGKQVALTQAIGGLGGVGKTQLALEYAYRYQKSYHDIFWVVADTYEALMTSYIHLAALLHLPEYKELDQHQVKEAVMRWFGKHTGWLLILDNMEDLSLVHEFVPPDRQGAVLLTTRRQVTEPVAQTLELGLLPENDSILFLLRRTKILTFDMALDDASTDDIEAARAISQALGHLPLALDQAGAYMLETGRSFAHYLDVFQKHRAELLRRRAGREIPIDHPEPVATTFMLNFQQVQQRSKVAAELLRVCAFLAPEGIGEVLLLQGASELGPHLRSLGSNGLLLDQAIETLRTFSLIQRDQEEKTLSIHRLVQAVLKDSMNQATRRRWATRIVQAVNTASPQLTYENSEWCKRLLPHLLECTQSIAVEKIHTREAVLLLNKCAVYVTNYNEAARLYEEAVTLAEQVLGDEHPETDMLLVNQLLLHHCKRKGEQLEFEEEMQIRGPWSRLGRATFQKYYMPAKDSPYAKRVNKKLAQDGLTAKMKAYHSEVAIDLECLANLLADVAEDYREAGMYEQAEPLLQQALTIFEEVWGPEYIGIAKDLLSLATLYSIQGKYEKAEPLYERALAIDERVISDNPLLADTLSTVGRFYRDIGKYEKAEPLLLRALAIQEQDYTAGDDDWRVLSLKKDRVIDLNNLLAELYKKQGKYDQAEPLYERVLAIVAETFGADDTFVVQELRNLALIYSAQDKFEQAEPLLQQALAIQEHVYAAGDASLVDAVVNNLSALATLYEVQGKDEQAEALLQRALSLLIDKTERTDNLKSLYYTWGEYEQAEALLQQVFAISERLFGLGHPRIAEGLHNLAKHYFQHSKYEQAEPLMLRAIAIREQALGLEHPETGKSLHNLGVLYMELSKFMEAEPLLRRSLKIYEETLGPEHPLTLLERVYLADICVELDKCEKAEALYKQVLPLFERLPGRNEHRARRNYAGLLRKLGREQEAVTLERDMDSDRTTASEDS